MGIVTQILGQAKFADNPVGGLDIEANLSIDGESEIVHLQTPVWRIDMSLEEFAEFAETVLVAGVKLRHAKGMPHDQGP